MTEQIFVYGTLRRDAPNVRPGLLGPGAEFVGYARMPGHLVDLGHFPGFVPAEDQQSHPAQPVRNHDGSASWVLGELYTLRNPARTLRRLDRYEGCGPDDPEPHLFERVVKTAIRNPGRQEDEEHGDREKELRDGEENKVTGVGQEVRMREDAWVYVYRGPTTVGTRIPSGDYASRRG